jgi:hypothetical protein
MNMPVHGLIDTPVVNFPQERVIDFDVRGLSVMASRTGGRASTPIPA